MRKRERIEIINDILKAIQSHSGKAKPTHILYKSNLSSQMLKDYLSELISKGLVEEKDKMYHITDKGHAYVKDFRMIRDFMESYDLAEDI